MIGVHIGKCLILLVLACISFAGTAQEYTAQYFTQKESSAEVPGDMIKISGGLLQCVETDKKKQLAYTAKLYKIRFGIKLIKYDDDMNVIKESVIDNGERLYGAF